MGAFTMTVLIVLIVGITRVMRERYRAIGRSGPAASSAEAVGARDEVRRLQERVAVLERVITDNHKSLDLDREIERLRDDRAARDRREQA